MAKIHGLAYILIGAFVSIMSWRLNQEKLVFFYYAGIAFVFVGAVKLAFNWIKSKANKPKTHSQQFQPQHAGHRKPNHPKPIQSSQQQIKYCPNCGAQLRFHNKFCTRCGAKL